MDFGGLPIGPREYWDVSSARRWRRRAEKHKTAGALTAFSSRAPRARADGGLDGVRDPAARAPQIDMLVLIDRDVDMVTPLCTQTTYEGLLDEVLGVSAVGTVAFSSSESAPEDGGGGGGGGRTVRARLDSGDALFAELRDLNFGRACETLRAKSSAMQSEYRDMQNTQRNAHTRADAVSVSAIGGFVRKMRANVTPGAGLELHAALAERALDSTRGDAHFQRVRFAEVLDSERLCLAGAAGSLQEGLQEQLLRMGGDPSAQERLGGTALVCARIESMLFRGENVRRAARLFALACLTHAGIPRKQYDALRREMVHAYGPPCVLLLQRMEEAGIAFAREEEAPPTSARSAAAASFAAGSAGEKNRDDGLAERRRRRRTAYANTRRSMRLLVDDLDDTDPDDIAYAYSHSGYAPLSVRLLLAAVESGWRGVEDALRKLPGPHFEYAQGRAAERADAADPGAPVVDPVRRDGFDAKLRDAKRAEATSSAPRARRPVVLAFFVGGVTRAEISCLRFASRKMRVGCDFVVGATSVVNGNGLIESLMDDARVFDPLDALDKLEVQGSGGGE